MVPPLYGMMGGMEKTTVYLTSQQKAALAQAAEEAGRSEAALIRAGIDSVTSRHRAAEPDGAVGVRPAVADPPDGRPDGRPDGASPMARPRWIDRASFVALLLHSQADPALRHDLRDLAQGTTDDEPLP